MYTLQYPLEMIAFLRFDRHLIFTKSLISNSFIEESQTILVFRNEILSTLSKFGSLHITRI